jgi:uncharacterized lipoprotein YajG
MLKHFLTILFVVIALLAGCKEKPCPISGDPKIALIDVNASSGNPLFLF